MPLGTYQRRGQIAFAPKSALTDLAERPSKYHEAAHLTITIEAEFRRQKACEICGEALRLVKSLKQPGTSVRYCSSACRRRRHNRGAR
mgnify:FL=1